ncbi:MAG: stage 0 sporulation family protein [Oscillospiraceae bacterium]|nr:stage 0 sporulation family protein [Oscillospiraceae bacterium]
MTEVISVRFRGGCKSYYFDPKGLQIAAGEHVIVETAAGTEFVTCCEGNHQVPDQSVIQPLRAVVRLATEGDERINQRNRQREKEAFGICEKKIAAHGLEMKLIRVESNFEGSKIIFFFTAEGRVDFRELVKDLAGVFRSRIELRQVGVRDEAKMIGGLGICGRPLCCSQFLEEFLPVSIKMAKTQNLSLNPTKISGTCGRLMCCLKYEQNAYEDAVKRMPKNDSFVLTPDGPGNVTAVDLLRQEMRVRLDESPESPKSYKNAEVVVLRNGKGSREGIEIPKERPARLLRPEEQPAEEERFVFDYAPRPLAGLDAAESEEEPKRQGRQRQRRRRGSQRHEGQRPPRQEGRESREGRPSRAEGEVVKVERISVKASGDLTAEKKAAADRKARGGGAPRKGGEGRPPKAAESSTERKSEGGAQHRRHRPRRRRGGGSPSEG